MFFRVLGEIGVTDGADVVPITGTRRRRVLAHLLARPNIVVPLDRLVAGAWPGTPPVSAVNSLQSHVSRLRQTVGPDRLQHTPGGYRLVVGDDDLDAAMFGRLLRVGRTALSEGRPEDAAAHLREALATWTGDPFAEFVAEPFVESRVAELTEQRRAVVEELVQARLELGEHHELCAELEPLTAEYPMRERLWEQRMLALYRSGRQAEALDVFGKVRRILGAELGVDPGPDLTRMHDAVLNHRPDLDWRPPAPPPATTEVTAPRELLEREDELLALRRATTDAASGRPSLILLEAPAGSGKSALLAETRRFCEERSVRVLSARGQPLEHSFAFGFVRQLLEPEVRGLDSDQLFAGPAAAARAVFLHDSPDGPPPDPFAVINALYWVVVGLAERNPLVLLADDAHLADEASQRLLAFLHPRIGSIRAMLVVASRPESEVVDAAAPLVPMLRDREVRRLRPRPLTLAATRALVADALGDSLGDRVSDVSAECHQRTVGNPLFVTQLISDLREHGVHPDGDALRATARQSVGRVVLGRLADLPDDCQRVAKVLAVLGDGVRLDLVARAGDLPSSRVEAAVERLVRSSILSPDRRLSFQHPIVRDAVYADLGSTLAAEEHLRVARVLHEAGVEDEQVALHLVQARGGDGPWVAEVLGRTGRAALLSGAPRVALEHLRRALVDAPSDRRPALLIDLGLAEGAVGDPSCLDTLEAAVDTAGRPETLLAASLALGPAYAMTGRVFEGLAVYERARERLAEHPDLAMTVDLTAAAVELMLVPPVALSQRMRRLEARYDELPESLVGPASAVLAGYAALVDGNLHTAVQRADLGAVRGAALASSQEAWDVAPALAYLAAGRYQDGAGLLSRVLDAARYEQHRVKRVVALWYRAWLRVHAGRLALAATDVEEMLRVYGDRAPVAPMGDGMLAEIRAEQGREQEAVRHAERALAADPSLRVVLDFVEVRIGRMWLALGRPDRALDILETAHENRQRRGIPATGLESVPPWLAIARHRCRQAAEAFDMAREGLERADRVGSPRARGIARTAYAEVAGDRPSADDAVGLLRSADTPLELARALLVRAELAPDDADDTSDLEEALDLATEHGYAALAGTVSARLRAPTDADAEHTRLHSRFMRPARGPVQGRGRD